MRVITILFIMTVFIPCAMSDPSVRVNYEQNGLNAFFTFDSPNITASKSGYDVLQITGLPLLESAGQPSLPFFHVRLLLPPDREVEKVSVSCKSNQRMDGKFRICPGPTPIPWQLKDIKGKNLQTHHPIYQKDAPFPSDICSPWRVSVMGGYRILSLNLYPVQYQPLSGTIRLNLEIEVAATFASSPVKSCSVRSDLQNRVVRSVMNPEAFSHYGTRFEPRASLQRFPYVIITAQKLLNLTGVTHTFESFVTFLASIGTDAKIVTVEEIYAQYPGKDQPDKIRNFIRYAFENWETSYVLLGGDADKGTEVVPVRRFPTHIHYVYLDGSSLTVDDNMAADYYYSALDGDFDGNGNGIYGEPDDNIDLDPEVYVGRAPVEDATQVDRFVAKTIAVYQYARNKGSLKTLVLGEKLFSTGECGVTHPIYGDDFMDELLKGASTHGFTTNGFSASWTVEKLYDRTSYWSGTTAQDRLNNSGAIWINHIGHSSPSYNMRLYSSSMASLTNEIPFIYITQGCNAGRFTNESTVPIVKGEEDKGSDCFAEKMITAEHGAFAVISNWSYGLSPEDPQTSEGDTPGANQYFHRLFVDAMFNPQSSLRRIGAMLSYSKEKMNPWLIDPQMQTQTVRWVYYEFNLLGDPYVPLPE